MLSKRITRHAKYLKIKHQASLKKLFGYKTEEFTLKTANVGGIDDISHVIPVEVHTEKVEDYSNRLSGKWYKTHHDKNIVWLDGSKRVYRKSFMAYIQHEIKDYDMLITKHPSRKTLGEEYDYVINNLDMPYLSVRYKDEPWEKEREAFKDSLDAPLVNPAFFALKYNEATQKLMKEWWDLILKYTIFDQSQITYLLYNNPTIKVKYIDWVELGKYVCSVGHKKMV